MQNNLYNTIYNPDVLSCIANLSNDEVFTPPNIANKMLDMLPQELFSDPNATFLDPACKSGVFLREIAKRLLKGLEKKIPNLQERTNHIFKKQLFGIAITELTSHLSRRSVYCSKTANGNYSVVDFDTVDGNIRFKAIEHVWYKGKCKFCGASKEMYNRGDELESHAYEFIHVVKPEEIFNMKFDVIVSNPPYQLSDGGAQASASPIYQLFVMQAKKLKPKYLVMIIPARWYAGGKGLDEFRNEMLGDVRIAELHDFPHTEDCFPGVNIRGGVCYFLWDKDKNLVDCNVVNHDGDTAVAIRRQLKYRDCDIFIRNWKSLSILEKIESQDGRYLNEIVSVRKPFGIGTAFSQSKEFHEKRQSPKFSLCCLGKGLRRGYIERRCVTAHEKWINRWKVFTSRANNIGTELSDDNLNAIVGCPNEVCTESYIVIGADMKLTKSQVKNLAQYLKTRFVRFCHALAKASQDATAKTYRFVPMQDFSKPWTDAELYKKYKLTNDEIAFIESMIKPME